MRLSRRAVVAGVAVFATAGALAVAAPLAFAATNLLTNPGFETGNLSGWSCASGATVGTGQARTGTFALTGTPGSNTTAKCQQTVTVLPNTAYSYMAFVRGSYVFIGLNGGASTWTPGTGTGYASLTVNFTTGSGVTSVTVYVHGWYGQPAFNADDLSLTGPGSPPPPPPPPTSGPPPTSAPPPPPTSAPPPPPTSAPPTTQPPTGQLPRHFLTGYWHNFVNPAVEMRLRDVPNEYDLIAV